MPCRRDGDPGSEAGSGCALGLNPAMSAIGLAAGLIAQASGLLADALDMLADATRLLTTPRPPTRTTSILR